MCLQPLFNIKIKNKVFFIIQKYIYLFAINIEN